MIKASQKRLLECVWSSQDNSQQTVIDEKPNRSCVYPMLITPPTKDICIFRNWVSYPNIRARSSAPRPTGRWGRQGSGRSDQRRRAAWSPNCQYQALPSCSLRFRQVPNRVLHALVEVTRPSVCWPQSPWWTLVTLKPQRTTVNDLDLFGQMRPWRSAILQNVLNVGYWLWRTGASITWSAATKTPALATANINCMYMYYALAIQCHILLVERER